MAVGLVESSGQGTGLAQVVNPQGFDTLASGVSNYIQAETNKKLKAEEEAKKLREKKEAEANAILKDSLAIKNGLFVKELRSKANQSIVETQEKVKQLILDGNMDEAKALIQQTSSDIDAAENVQKEIISVPLGDPSKWANLSQINSQWGAYLQENPEMSISDAAIKYADFAKDLKQKKELLQLEDEASKMYGQIMKNIDNVDMSEMKKMYPNQSDAYIRKKVKEDIALETAQKMYLQEKPNYDLLGMDENEAIQNILRFSGVSEKLDLQTPRRDPNDKPLPAAGQPYTAMESPILSEEETNKVRLKEQEYASLDPVKDKERRAEIKGEIDKLKKPFEVQGRTYPDSKESYTIIVGGQNVSPRVIKKAKGKYYLEGVVIGEGQSFQAGGDNVSTRTTVSKGTANVALSAEEQKKVLTEWNRKNGTNYTTLDQLIRDEQGGEATQTEYKPSKVNYGDK